MNIHWKNWCWSWSSNNLPTWCEELTHWKRPWWWEGLKGGGEGDDRGWDGWMALLTRWAWVWANSGSWWWTGKPGMLQSMGSQRVDMTEQLNWTESSWLILCQELYSTSSVKLSAYLNQVGETHLLKQFSQQRLLSRHTVTRYKLNINSYNRI